MYEIHCQNCAMVGFHPSMTGAESRAEAHMHKTGHECSIEPMEGEFTIAPRRRMHS